MFYANLQLQKHWNKIHGTRYYAYFYLYQVLFWAMMSQNSLKDFPKISLLSFLISGFDQKPLIERYGTILKYIVKFGWEIIGWSIDGPQFVIILLLRSLAWFLIATKNSWYRIIWDRNPLPMILRINRFYIFGTDFCSWSWRINPGLILMMSWQ